MPRNIATPSPHQQLPVTRLECSNEHGPRNALTFGYQVHAMVHAVGEVDVDSPRLSEHGFVAPSPAAERVTGGIVRASISLDLDDPPRDDSGSAPPNEKPA
jgi:hypothetical protein